MRPPNTSIAAALARSLEACRQHVVDVIAALERAAARDHYDAYRAAERSLAHALVRLADIVDEARVLATVADDITARRLRAAPDLFAELVEAAANLPPRPRRVDAGSSSPRRCLRARRSRRTRTHTTITLDTSR